MGNFQEILNKKAEEVEKPKPLPVGTYTGIVKGLPEFSQVGKNQTDMAAFKIGILACEEDVDQEALANALNGKSLSDIAINHRLFLTEDAAWRIKKFLVEDLGIEEGGKTLGELLNDAPGCQFKFYIKHRPAPDGTAIFAEIDKTMPA